MNIRRIAIVLAILPSACSTAADPPSLLPRAIESQSREIITAPADAPAAADTVLVARLKRLFDDARAGDAMFAAAEKSNASSLNMRRTAVEGSEAWIATEMARSALEVARQRSASALADVDALLVENTEAASGGNKVAGLAEILAVQSEIAAIVDRQTRRLNTLTR